MARAWSEGEWSVNVAYLIFYGIAFTALRFLSAHWGTYEIFSLWFPAAGLRFAALWLAGARWAVPMAVAEYIVGVISGTVVLEGNILLASLGVLGPCLAYGFTIGVLRGYSRRARGEFSDAMQFTSAAVVGPFTACIAALPWALPLTLRDGHIDGAELTSALLVFSLGDLLGVILVAPPLLFLFHFWQRGTHKSFKAWLRMPSTSSLFGAMLPAWMLVALLYHFGHGLALVPVLLASCWLGLSQGRVAAWLSAVLAAAIVLPFTASLSSAEDRIHIHIILGCIAAGAFLAGSYSDGDQRASAEIKQRDRLLFQADRLKTLRAMSLALIHEISQPLTTIALEARGLRSSLAADDLCRDELSSAADLMAKKADQLVEMIERLRNFGSGTVQGRTRMSVGDLLSKTLAMIEPEARTRGTSIALASGPSAHIELAEVELTQAMLNLLRNALQASAPQSSVNVEWSVTSSEVIVTVSNKISGRSVQGGMGVGLIIARTIIEAHGGHLFAQEQKAGEYVSRVHLVRASEAG